MADLATLRIAVDSRPVDQAANDLDELAASARRAEGANDSLTSSTRTTSAAMAGMSNAVRQATAAQEAAATAVAGVGGAAGLSANQMTNLSYQVQDLVVQLASGTPPMMAFMQQGSQIAGIMQTSGMSVMGFTKAVIASTAAALAAVAMNPVFLAIAATVGIVSAAVNMMADDITKSSGVTVTATDVMLGAFDVLRDYVANKVTAAFNYFGIDAGKAWDTVVSYTRKAINIVIGLASLVPRVFAEAFQVVPQIISKVFSGDFSGALSLALSSARNIAVGTFQRDFIGDLGSVLRDAAVNRATQRQAEETGRSVGRAIGRGAREAVKAELGDLLTDIDQILVDAAKRMNASDIARQEMETTEFWDVIQKKGEAEVKAAQDAAEARAKSNRELQKTVGYLDDILGLDGQMGKLFKNLQKAFPEFFAQLSKAFGGLRDAIGGVLAKLGTSFKQLGASAAIGGASAGILGKLGAKTSNIGGQIGGAIGGAAFGPLGAIAGGMIGGLLGGMFKTVKKASATIEGVGGRAVLDAVKGNSASFKRAATGMANSLIAGLTSAADALGGTIADFAISIGKRNGSFRVDPTGQGRTKGMPKFKTEQEAINFALKTAIEQGAIAGLKASTQALIKAGDDVQAQLEKAVRFEGVFKDLLRETNPLQASLNDLEMEMVQLRRIFDEAGASAAEYAQLEELFAIKRKKAEFEAGRPRRELEIALMEAQGDVAGALAAKRALELEAMDENLRSIQQQVWAAEDATKAANEYKAALEGVTDSIVDEIKRLRGITATTSLASLKAQFGILTAQARGGNIEALGKLPELSQAIEAATIADATSTLEIARIRAWLDRSLSETLASQGGSVDLASIASTSTFNGNQVSASTSGNQTADQISVLREEMRQALFQIAKNTGRSYDLLDRWDGDGLPETRTLA